MAMSLFKSLFRRQTPSAEAARLLGNRHLSGGELDQAAACYRDALRFDPNYAEAYNNLGYVLKEQRRFAEAAAMLDRALAIKSDLGPAHLNRGVVAFALGEQEAAQRHFEQAAIYLPGTAECYWRLGDCLFARREFEAAIRQYEVALAIDADLPGTWVNIGSAYYKLGRYDEAAPYYLRALEEFRRPEAAYFIGIIHQARGDWRQSLASYRQALDLQPNFVQAHWNLALVSLLQGDYSAATWRHFERRLDVLGVVDDTMLLDDVRRYLLQFGIDRYWRDGVDLVGKRLLIWAEQGLGDTLMTMRYLPLLKSRGATEVLLYADVPLVRLAQTMTGVDRVIPKTQLVPDDCIDLHLSTLSLPARFVTSADSVAGCPVPYLRVPEDMACRWATRCSALPGLKVGLAWAGNRNLRLDAQRSVALETLSPLMEIHGISWLSLQKGESAGELKVFPWPVVDWMDECEDMLDTAALVVNLDIIISVDTSVAHLAGALGRPVWLLNRYASDWRWMLGREDSPWYPTMRIFTQPQAGDWAAVIVRVRDALRAETAR